MAKKDSKNKTKEVVPASQSGIENQNPVTFQDLDMDSDLGQALKNIRISTEAIKTASEAMNTIVDVEFKEVPEVRVSEPELDEVVQKPRVRHNDIDPIAILMATTKNNVDILSTMGGLR